MAGVFFFISSSVVCLILCPVNELVCELQYILKFVVLMAQFTKFLVSNSIPCTKSLI